MRLCNLALCSGLFGLLVFSSTGFGETIVSFTGKVDVVPEELESDFAPGMDISGSYTFDESATGPSFTTIVSDFRMSLGDSIYQQATGGLPGDISVTSSEYIVVSIAQGPAVGDNIQPLLMALQMSASSNDLNPSTPVPPDLDRFDSPLWTLDFQGVDATYRLQGTVQTLSVPEPSGMALAFTAVIGLGTARRRPRRAQHHPAH